MKTNDKATKIITGIEKIEDQLLAKQASYRASRKPLQDKKKALLDEAEEAGLDKGMIKDLLAVRKYERKIAERKPTEIDQLSLWDELQETLPPAVPDAQSESEDDEEAVLAPNPVAQVEDDEDTDADSDPFGEEEPADLEAERKAKEAAELAEAKRRASDPDTPKPTRRRRPPRAKAPSPEEVKAKVDRAEAASAGATA